jgi:hypothetical protein
MKNKSLQQQLDWLEREKEKDELMVNREKNQLISQIKKIKKRGRTTPKTKKN